MNILYCGQELPGYIFEITAEKNNCHYRRIEIDSERSLLSKYKEEIVKEKPDILALFIENFDGEDLVETIKEIMSSVAIKIVVLAPGQNKEINLIQSLMAQGVNNFIFEKSNQSKQLDEVHHCFFHSLEPSIENQKQMAKELETKKKKEEAIFCDNFDVVPEGFSSTKKRVAVVGSLSRIGTTSIAIQLIKLLMYHGQKACYIERNNSNYLSLMKENYNVTVSEKEVPHIQYEKVDLYSNLKNIKQILMLDYDYYIYDYGQVTENNIDSIFEKDIIIVVGGTAPSEIQAMEKAIREFYSQDAYYIFNFTDLQEQKDIQKLMVDKASYTGFFASTPDPFKINLDNLELGKMIFREDIKKEVAPKTKKRGWFRK